MFAVNIDLRWLISAARTNEKVATWEAKHFRSGTNNNYKMAGCDKKFKLMMLGDAGVGKTSIARRFVDQVNKKRNFQNGKNIFQA